MGTFERKIAWIPPVVGISLLRAGRVGLWLAVVLWSQACTTGQMGDGPPGTPEVQQDCQVLPQGLGRDTCLHDRLLDTTPADASTIPEQAASIADPLVRSAAVFGWVKEHGNQVTPAMARRLCSTIDNPERDACLRRLSSAHLQR